MTIEHLQAERLQNGVHDPPPAQSRQLASRSASTVAVSATEF
jgi:hypothetical protein